MSLTDIIVLTHPEDWESWFDQVRAYAHPEIWPHVDPNADPPQRGLLAKPVRPEFRDFDSNASTYTQLSAGHQRVYDNSQKYYDQDMKYFDKQEERLRDVQWQSGLVTGSRPFLL